MRFGKATPEVERFMAWCESLPIPVLKAMIDSMDRSWHREYGGVLREVMAMPRSAAVLSAFESSWRKIERQQRDDGLQLDPLRESMYTSLLETTGWAIVHRDRLSREQFELAVGKFWEVGYDFDASDSQGAGV